MRTLFLSILSLATLTFGSVAFAAEQNSSINVLDLPKLEMHVTDFAGVLDEATLAELNEHAYNYEQTSGRQFVAVLIPERQGHELFDISLKIFNDNGIGSKQENDGLLLVIATDEKKIRIMVGYGLEGEMPDVLASKIIEEDVRPLVDAGDYAGAVRTFYARAEEAISAGEAKALQPSDEMSDDEGILLGVAIMAFLFGRTYRSARKAKKKSMRSVLPIGLVSLILLIVAVATINVLVPLILYIGATFFGYLIGAATGFFPGGGHFFGGGFSGGSGRGGGGGGFSGGFSGGGGSSGGGGAGD